MKKIRSLFKTFLATALLLAFALGAHAQVKAVKYGALAIDKANGFYYGWATDQATLAAAEKRALEECTKKGGKGAVVLAWSGAACAVYRTVDGKVGTAYGWGIGKTQAEADAIATKECQKRSNGRAAGNHVWGCNSNDAGPMKTIKNVSAQIKGEPAGAGPVTGYNEGQLSGLRKGGKTVMSTTRYTFSKAIKEGELFLFKLNGDDFYKYINPYCIVDKNGRQVAYGGERYFENVETFLTYTVNDKEGKDYTWAMVTVKDFYKKDERFGASFHEDLKYIDAMETAMERWKEFPKDKEEHPDNFSNIYNDVVVYTDKAANEVEKRDGRFCFEQYRYEGQRTNYKTEFNSIAIN